MDRFGLARGWTLARTSMRLLAANRQLVWFSVLSGACTLAALVAFGTPVVIMSGLGGAAGFGDPFSLLLLFLFYLLTSFIVTFFNTALVGAVLARLRDGDRPAVSRGLGVAYENIEAVALYAVLSATIGVVLYVLEERVALAGRIALWLLGGAWAVVTFLVVPVIVAEGRMPVPAIRRSAALLRQTWGAQLTGGSGIGLLSVVIAAPGAILVVIGLLAGGALAVLGVVAGGAWLALAWAVGSALDQIFRAAVYLYAETGVPPAGFDQRAMIWAFRARS